MGCLSFSRRSFGIQRYILIILCLIDLDFHGIIHACRGKMDIFDSADHCFPVQIVCVSIHRNENLKRMRLCTAVTVLLTLKMKIYGIIDGKKRT